MPTVTTIRLYKLLGDLREGRIVWAVLEEGKHLIRRIDLPQGEKVVMPFWSRETERKKFEKFLRDQGIVNIRVIEYTHERFMNEILPRLVAQHIEIVCNPTNTNGWGVSMKPDFFINQVKVWHKFLQTPVKTTNP